MLSHSLSSHVAALHQPLRVRYLPATARPWILRLSELDGRSPECAPIARAYHCAEKERYRRSGSRGGVGSNETDACKERDARRSLISHYNRSRAAAEAGIASLGARK